MITKIEEGLILALDLGIASCGWALLRYHAPGHGSIVDMGVWLFDAPETDKERTPTNQLRRQHRGLRRVLHRRRQRMAGIRTLFADAGLIPTNQSDALKRPGLDPWNLRAEALDRKLTGEELAIALGHIARHRGFKSNSKRDKGGNASKDTSAMLGAIDATREKLAQYRTVGEMFARDEEYRTRKRNRDGDYTRSVLRDDQLAEVKSIFQQQRRFKNAHATEKLEDAFIDVAFYQRPLRDSDDLVGFCPFETGERRAARHAPSFERFRMLSRLMALRIGPKGHEETPLSEAQLQQAEAGFGKQKTVSYKTLRNILGLGESIRFAGVSDEHEKNDFVVRTGSAAEGTSALRNAVTEYADEHAWKSLLNTPEKLDAAAAIITFRDDLASIRNGLSDLSLEPTVLEALMAAVESGKIFEKFKGAGHISAKACRALIPHLRKGMIYSDACAAAGYTHTDRVETKIEEIGNPIARKAFSEAMKQVKALIQVYGLPGAIHVELARDVGKSKEERDQIRSGIDKRTKTKEKLKELFKTDVGAEPKSGEDLLRYELWREQNGRCLYSDRTIDPRQIVSTDRTLEVDHILPWSRSFDDSFQNKTLCFAKENQDKKGRTPYEWMGGDASRWDLFVAAVESNKQMKGFKKRNYLLKNSKLLEEKFSTRNLNDTRYAARLLAGALDALYPETDTRLESGKTVRNRRIRTRPGQLTNILRHSWGLQRLKKDLNDKRLEDSRHHALDAVIVAAATESTMQQITKIAQEAERRGERRIFVDFPEPWDGFVSDVEARYRELFVARAERRRARGEAHAATIRQISERDGVPIVYERKPVDKLTEADLKRIKDPERNAKLIHLLKQWIAAGKPNGGPPTLQAEGNGGADKIRKVRLATDKKADVLVRDGAADRGEMARVDVFRKQNARGKWEYFLVPIYPHQVFDEQDWPLPPNRAVAHSKPEPEWPEMTTAHEFLWSIYPMSFLEVEKLDGTLIDGYFRGLDRSTGAIHLSKHHSKDILERGIGVKTAKAFRKYQITRLGQRFEIEREKRTWHGVVCT